MPKVAFLMLDDIHHIHHLAPLAFELSQQVEYHCVIYIQKHSATTLRQVALLYPQHRCQVCVLAPGWWRRIKSLYRRRTCSSSHIIRHHAKQLLKHFDALISPDCDMDELVTRTRSIKPRPLLAKILHGAGDRNNYKTLDGKIRDYDLILISGNKYMRRLAATGDDNSGKLEICGYPKFDIIPATWRPKLFADDKPIVLYNPHFILTESSWEEWGFEILDYFYQNTQWNFIFAPHCNLFRRELKNRMFPKKYFSAKNMIIDLGSEKSVDMTYTQAADVYVGDMSSQVYEFIRIPRPCVFLNAHHVDWRQENGYRSWQLGQVVENLADFRSLFSHSPIANPYVELQQQFFADTFSITQEKSGVRGAKIIQSKLEAWLTT